MNYSGNHSRVGHRDNRCKTTSQKDRQEYISKKWNNIYIGLRKNLNRAKTVELNFTSISAHVRIKYNCEHSLFQAWPVQEKWSGYTCCSGRSLLYCLGMNPIHNARFAITSKLDYYCYYKYCYYKLPLANSGMGLS